MENIDKNCSTCEFWLPEHPDIKTPLAGFCVPAQTDDDIGRPSVSCWPASAVGGDGAQLLTSFGFSCACWRRASALTAATSATRAIELPAANLSAETETRSGPSGIALRGAHLLIETLKRQAPSDIEQVAQALEDTLNYTWAVSLIRMTAYAEGSQADEGIREFDNWAMDAQLY